VMEIVIVCEFVTQKNLIDRWRIGNACEFVKHERVIWKVEIVCEFVTYIRTMSNGDCNCL
jgi:hypothetical protein